MEYKYLNKKVRFDNWPKYMFWLIDDVTDGFYSGCTYANGKKHNKLRLTIGFTHRHYAEITTKVIATRLAKKMYPKAKEEDGYLLIEDIILE